MAQNESNVVGFFDIQDTAPIDPSNGQAGVVSPLISATSVRGLSSFQSGVEEFQGDVESGIVGGIRGWSTSVVFSSSAYNSVSWTAGTVNLSNGLSYNLLSGSLTLTGTHYLYLDTSVSETTLQSTTDQSLPVGQTKLMVAIASISSDTTTKALIKTFGGQGDSQLITALNVANGAITAAKTAIAAINPSNGEINENKVGTTQLDNGAVTGVKILNGEVSATKLNVAAIDSSSGDLTANSVKAVNIQAGSVTTDKIYAGAVTASKITSYNFVVSEGTFTNNSPTAGSVAWSGVKVVYNGVEYSLANGYAPHKYFYWRLAYPTVMSSLNDLPDLGNDDFLILINNSGTYTLAWNSTRIDGGRITTGSITSTQIAANTITASNIQSGTITTDKFTANTISGNIIQTGTLNADRITAGSITTDRFTSNSIDAAVISAGTLTADKLSTSLLYAGSIQISTGGNVRSGQTDYATGTGWFIGNSGGTPKFSIGSDTTYLKWDGSSLETNGITTKNATDGIKATMVGGGSYYENYVSKQRAYVNGALIRMTQELSDTTETTAFRVVGVNDSSNPRVTMEFYYGLNMRGEIRPLSNGLFVGGGDYGLTFKTSSLEPTLAGSYNLGSPTYYYNNLNFQNLAFRNPSISYTGKTLVGYLPITVGTDTRYIAFYS